MPGIKEDFIKYIERLGFAKRECEAECYELRVGNCCTCVALNSDNIFSADREHLGKDGMVELDIHLIFGIEIRSIEDVYFLFKSDLYLRDILTHSDNAN